MRLEKALEVRSLVRLKVSREQEAVKQEAVVPKRPVECKGRVAWVTQRLDLRNAPPFLFDIGIEFVNPPAFLRKLMESSVDPSLRGVAKSRRDRILETYEKHERTYTARLKREENSSGSWHLIVSVEGVPCFSGRYTSEKAAVSAWTQYKRRQIR